MKIAQVVGPQIPFSPDLPHTPFSITAIAYLITEELVKRGHAVTFFGPNDSITSAKIAPNTVSSKFINKHHLEKARIDDSDLLKNIFYNHALNVAKLSENFDIIHVHGLTFHYFHLPMLCKKPVVTTLHQHPVYLNRKKYLLEKTNRFIAISHNQMKQYPLLNFVGVAHNGIQIEDFGFNPSPKNYVAWLGRITPLKGPLEAIKAALKSNQTIKLAGNIEAVEKNKKYTKEIFKLIKKHKNVSYIGEVRRDEKVNFLKNAKAVLMPIRWAEPFGLVAIEAMACGTPVIAFNKGALPEIVEHGKTGFIVNTIAQMAETIKKIEKINRIDCRKLVEKKFTVEKMVDSYEKIYKQIIKSNK